MRRNLTKKTKGMLAIIKANIVLDIPTRQLGGIGVNRAVEDLGVSFLSSTRSSINPGTSSEKTRYTISDNIPSNKSINIVDYKINLDAENYYFKTLPYIKIGNSSNFSINIIEKKTKKQTGEVYWVRFRVLYKNKKSVLPSSPLRCEIGYDVEKHVLKKPKINNVVVGKKIIKPSGESRRIKIIGTPGVKWGMTINETRLAAELNDAGDTIIGSRGPLMDKHNDVSIISGSDPKYSVTKMRGNYGKKINVIHGKIDKSGVSSFTQIFPSVIAKKTKIRTNASSASQTLVSARGIKEGDKIYCDKIPKGESVIVRTVNTSTGVVGLSQSLNLTAGDKVEFKRFRRYAINLVEDMCGDIDPEFRKIEFDPYGWKDKIWPTTWFSLYQNLETDISIVNSWKDTNIGTITKLNNVNTGLSKGAPLTIKTYGVVGQNYHEVKISLLIDLFDAAHTFTGARKPSNFAPWAPKRLDSNNNLIAGVSKNFWTNTNPKENGGTRFQIKNWSHDGLGENTITINYTMCISRFGTEPVTLEVKIDDILSHA